VGESLRYAAYLDGEVVALLRWAAALNNRPRDRYLAWDAGTKRTQLHLVVNNARFLILPWIRQPHLASRVLGRTLRRLRRHWEHAYGHPVVLAETFVDPSRFRGTCNRASNWLWVGETTGWAKRGRHVSFPRPAQGGVAVSAAPRLQGGALPPRDRAHERGGSDDARCGEASPCGPRRPVRRPRWGPRTAPWPLLSVRRWLARAASPPLRSGRRNNLARRSRGWAPRAARRRARGVTARDVAQRGDQPAPSGERRKHRGCHSASEPACRAPLAAAGSGPVAPRPPRGSPRYCSGPRP
jgi:hypothetical protein